MTTLRANRPVPGQRRLLLTLSVWLLAATVSQAAAPPAILPHPSDPSFNLGSTINLTWSVGEMELLSNGGFEFDLASWTTEIDGFGGILIQDGTVNPAGPDGPIPPLEGEASLLLQSQGFGGFGVQLTAFQNVVLPTTGAGLRLSWSDRIRNYGDAYNGNPQDFHGFRVELRMPNNAPIAVLYTTESGDEDLNNWIKREVDVSDYRGQTVRLAFIAASTGGNVNVHLDRIRMILTEPEAVSHSVYLATSPVIGPGDLQGSTPDNTWTVSDLAPFTTYYWRINTTADGFVGAGPTWEFTTAPLGGLNHFQWDLIASAQPAGSLLPVRVTARDASGFLVTNFTGTATLSAEQLQPGPSQTLQTEEPYTALAIYENATVGYAFTPSETIRVTALRSFSGDQISLWNDQGIRLARVASSGPAESWTEIPLPSPVILEAGRTYRIGAFVDSEQFQFARFDHPGVFSHGTIDESFFDEGEAFPQTPHPARFWLLDLRYETVTTSGSGLVPGQSGTFAGGEWTGDVTVPGLAGDTLRLIATSDGISGASNPFDVTGMLAPQLSIQLQAGNPSVSFHSMAGALYQLERRQDADGGAWLSVGDPVPGTGQLLEITDSGGVNGSAFYRVRILP